MFDFDPMGGPTVGAGLGWRTESGLDLRARASPSALFNDSAGVFPVRQRLVERGEVAYTLPHRGQLQGKGVIYGIGATSGWCVRLYETLA